MDGYSSNSECVLDYLDLFQALSAGEPDAAACRDLWNGILQREAATGDVQLAPPHLRYHFALGERDFLLVMAALALEMDGGLRNAFRRKYALALPTLEYGLQLISPLCPTTCGTLAELAGTNMLCGLLLTTSEQTSYPMERPLILCRTAAAFLTGLSIADIPGCSLLTDQGERWLPLYEDALKQLRGWYEHGSDRTLYLCAPAGSGRRTLLRRACGNVVCADLEDIGERSALDQDHALREAAVLALLLEAPVCALPDAEKKTLRALERLCRKYAVPLAVLAGGDSELEDAQEVLRLPQQLSAPQRLEAWSYFLPQARPGTVPKGAMTVGALLETAMLAERSAILEGRERVCPEDTRRAMLQRGGALTFGVRYEIEVTMEDMVLPAGIRAQLELICHAVQSGDRLAAWGLPRQGEGVTAVFHGPSGTGKTMAASAIANRLGMPLLRADLSQIMDKYVGETEKHLGRLLRSARENHCVLLFDEADSLFGKRTGLSTGHDKYANLSTSYLLQEIERYDGVALLSTNLLSNFDDAFLRRLQYIVRFPLPDAVLRETLWRQALPADRCEEELPYAQLAQAELSPARILSAARGAAVAALAAGKESVDAAGVAQALRLELEKDSKALPRALLEWL